MLKPRIVLYGGPDQSPNLMMNEIQGAADEFDVLRLPGHGGDHTTILMCAKDVQGAVALLVGFSHDYRPEHRHTGPQIDLTKAVLAGKDAPRIVYIEDVPGNGTEYDAVREVAPHATLLAAAPNEEEAARQFGWRDVIHVTIPAHWKNWIQKIKTGLTLRGAGKLRARRHGSEEETDAGERPVIYIAGYKNPAVEAAVLQSVRDALDKALGAENYVLHFRRDKREDNIAIPDLERLKALREQALAGILELANPELDSNEALTGASTVNITHPGSSLVPGIVGSMRLNVVSLMDYVQEQQTNYDYRGNAERGTLVVNRASDAGAAVLRLLEREGVDALRAKQASHMKALPADWDGGRAIIEWIKGWMK